MPWTPLDTPRKVHAFGARSNPRAFRLARIRRPIKSPASLSLQLGIYATFCGNHVMVWYGNHEMKTSF